MKKLAVLLVLVLTLVLASTAPAFAAVRVTAHAKARVHTSGPSKVVFTAHVTRRGHVRRGHVRVTVYRSGHAIRTFTAKRSGAGYAASWTLSSAARRRALAGAYSYKVRVRTKTSGRGATSGHVTVPATPPTPTPAVPTTDTATTPSVPPVTVTPTVAPVPVPVPAASASRWVGYYIPGCPTSLDRLNTLQSQIGTRAAVLNFFMADSESFPGGRVENAQSNGSIPLITLEFHKTVDQRGVDSITNGECDAYLVKFAAAAKANGGEIWLRPFHEMNGDWSAWCGVVGNNSAAKTVAAWRHIHDVLYAEGATNVKFVWNVNGLSCPNTAANAIEKYWPGDAYVDYTSIDGYNFGNHASWSRWSTPESIFGDAYRRINALSAKPMFIAEMSCTSNGGDKAAWMTEFFTNMKTRFPKIVGVCWFNADKEEDWRVEETPATLAVMQKLATTGY